MRIVNTNYSRILILLAVVTLLLRGCSSDPYGAKVVVENVGTAPLHSVVVRVTGNSYSIGELPVRESRDVKTYPTGESHIVIEHIDQSGNKKELPFDCYFEPGYRSTIRVKVTSDKAVKTEY
jgi:hypothetical protein